jgi:3-oxoacyl-[acyl-carrier protein] reductase
MNLELNGKRALVCAASKGLGYGCALALAREGVEITIVARTLEPLVEAAKRIEAETRIHVVAVAADIATPAGREAALTACPQPDILVNNAGGPPPGDFRNWTRDDWIKALDANMLTPIELIKATVDGMIERKFGRIVNITSAAVKAPIDTLGLSNGARSGLTGFVAGLSRQIAQHNVTINNLLPGAFDTDRLKSNIAGAAKSKGVDVDSMTAQRRASVPAKRFGTALEFGQYCAFLCSAQAGYITGQNLLIDGGAYPGTF